MAAKQTEINLTQAEFKGYVKAKLDNIYDQNSELKTDLGRFKDDNSVAHNTLFDRIRKVEKKPTSSFGYLLSIIQKMFGGMM